MSDDIFRKIDSKEVTVEDFNTYISQIMESRRAELVESLPDVVGFNADRIRRKLNPKRKVTAKAFGNTLTPDGIDPKSSLTPKRGAHGRNVDPTKTATGRRAVSEAKERLTKNWMSSNYKCESRMDELIVSKLLVTELPAEVKDWLYSTLR